MQIFIERFRQYIPLMIQHVLNGLGNIARFAGLITGNGARSTRRAGFWGKLDSFPARFCFDVLIEW